MGVLAGAGSGVLGGAAGVLCTSGAADVVGDPWADVPLVPPGTPEAIGEDDPASFVNAIASAALTVVTVWPAGAGSVAHQTIGAVARMASPTTRLVVGWWWDNQRRLRAWW
jgi:hypothetical protein